MVEGWRGWGGDPGKWATVEAWVTPAAELSAQGAALCCHCLLPLWAF